jgi:hypothetical protein
MRDDMKSASVVLRYRIEISLHKIGENAKDEQTIVTSFFIYSFMVYVTTLPIVQMR